MRWSTRILRRLGFRGQVLAVNDALIALVAGADDEPGVVVIAGTGSIAYGVGRAGHRGAGRRLGRSVRRRGLGVLGRRGWRWPRWCGPPIVAVRQTALTPLVLRHAGADRIDGLVAPGATRAPDRRQAIAAMAGLVARAEADGDAVARRDPALRRPAELTLAARSVVEQLGMRGERFRVVLSGGLVQDGADGGDDGGGAASPRSRRGP